MQSNDRLLPHPNAVTANLLLDGETVYLREDQSWTRDHREARLAHSLEAAERLLTTASSQADIVVGPRLIVMEARAGGTHYPRDFRERARIKGPTVGPVRFSQAAEA